MKEIQGGGGVGHSALANQKPAREARSLAVKKQDDTSWKKGNSRDVRRTKKDAA